MHAQHVFIAGRLGSEDIGGIGDALGDQAVTHQTVFSRGKNVSAEIQIVTGVINEFERQHF